jgi:hypothetical protein
VEAACKLLQNALTAISSSSADENAANVSWKHIVDTGLRHRVVVCQEAAAEVYGVYSGFTDFSGLHKR